MISLYDYLDSLLVVGVISGLLLGLAAYADAKTITPSVEPYPGGEGKVSWVGEFPVADDGCPAVLPEIQIGLRSDGVVVWRRK